MPTPPNPCASCGAPVQVRRPSRSGKHFCQASKCQTAKQRHYRDAKAITAGDLTTALIRTLAHNGRRVCGRCGLENALPGWAHRSLHDPVQPCYGTGALGPGLPAGLLDAIHPELAPGGAR